MGKCRGNRKECSGRMCTTNLCSKHYQRFRKFGSLELPTFEDKLVNRIKISKTKGCWLWQESLMTNGYGRIHVHVGYKKYVRQMAHRAVYEHFFGKIPKNMHLDHLCRVKSCVRPDHLEPVTVKENLYRGNGWPGLNKRKTHCKKGHAYTKESVYVDPKKKSTRACRICRRLNYSAWLSKNSR